MGLIEDIKIGHSYNVYPVSEDTSLATEVLKRSISGKGISVLDMGTGSGAIGISAAKSSDVERVMMADIDDNAVSAAKENVELNSVINKCSILQSDLFENIQGKFDIIIFNPPYLPDDEVKASKNEWSGGRTGIETTKRFIEESRSHLKQNGTIIIVKSSFADPEGLDSFIKEKGFVITDSEKAHAFFEDITAIAIKRA